MHWSKLKRAKDWFCGAWSQGNNNNGVLICYKVNQLSAVISCGECGVHVHVYYSLNYCNERLILASKSWGDHRLFPVAGHSFKFCDLTKCWSSKIFYFQLQPNELYLDDHRLMCDWRHNFLPCECPLSHPSTLNLFNPCCVKNLHLHKKNIYLFHAFSLCKSLPQAGNSRIHILSTHILYMVIIQGLCFLQNSANLL